MDAELDRLPAQEAASMNSWTPDLYRSFFEASPDALFLLRSEDFAVCEANPVAAEMFGYTREEILTLNALDLVVDRSETEKCLRNNAVLSKCYRLQLRWCKKKDGLIFPAEISVSFFAGKDGQMLSVVVHDISTRHILEKEVRNHELALDSISDAVVLADEQARVTYTNKAFGLLYGQSREAMLGQDVRHLVYGEALTPELDKRIGETLKADRPWRDEIKRSLPSGECVLEALAEKYANESGTPVGRMWILRDITAKKRTEDALKNSEERYRTVVENQTELICRLSPDGRVTFANEAYAKYYGKKPEEIIGIWIAEHIPKEDRLKDEEHLNRLTPENPVAYIEHRAIVAGQVRWQHWTDRAIFDAKGEVVEYQSVGRDITEKKLAEERLFETERALKALGAGIQAITHAEDEQQAMQGGLSHHRQGMWLPISLDRFRPTEWDQVG